MTLSIFVEIISCVAIIAWLVTTAIFLFYFFYGLADTIKNWFKNKRKVKRNE